MASSPIRQLSRSKSNDVSAWAGWDIGLAAFALACMTTGFWRLWPGALSLADAPLGPMILKAGLAALGFVAVATRWEDAVRALARNPLILVLMALACSSAIWAVVPADALRNSIMMIVIWVFGVALSLRFRPRELAEICGFAGLFGVMAQFAAHQNMPPVSAFDGDVAFAIMGSAWAALSVPTRRSLWLLALGACCSLAFAAGDTTSLGAGVGLIIGCGIAQIGSIRGRQGAISVLVTAWLLVALISGVTLFVLFGADPISAKIAHFFAALGPHAIIGQGFGISGQSVANALGAGLGVVGVALGGLLAFATLFQALLSGRQSGSRADSTVAIWFATLGAMLLSPADIGVYGPISILFAASSFSISLSSVSVPRPRRALLETPTPRQVFQDRRPTILGKISTPPNAPSLSEMGLRPKR